MQLRPSLIVFLDSITPAPDDNLPAMIKIIEDQSASAATQPGPAEFLARHEPMSSAGLRLIESASEEHSIEFSRTGGLPVSSSQDRTDAVLNPDDEYFSWHVRRTLCKIALRAPSFDLTRIDHQYIRFRSKLIAALLDEPIEDGVTHPAEHVIDEALRTNSSEWRDWLARALNEHYQTRPSLSASIVRCIGRLDYDCVGGWGMRVIDDALRHKDVEVREAAVRALEAWGGYEALNILRSHRDSVAWLNEYVDQVIVDLSGTTS